MALGRSLLEKLGLHKLRDVEGVAKLEKKVRQEVKFLEKFEAPEKFSKLKKEHISCSNLSHQACIVNQLLLEESPQAVLQPFSIVTTQGEEKKLMVDIVSGRSSSWVKVVARNPRALAVNSLGGAQFGQKNIVDQVKEFVLCAKQNQVLFSPPSVTFVFACGVTRSLRDRLVRRGAEVKGELVSVGDEQDESEESEEESDEDDESLEDEEDVRVDIDAGIDHSRLNLDITAMIAYVSALTNGGCNFTFKEPVLCQQAAWEREKPVKTLLDSLFSGKELLCCHSAMQDFKTILATLGGEGERIRADELIARVTVVDDQESLRSSRLEYSGKINERSRTIFGTGDLLRVVTITANTGFIRAAQGQGVTFAVLTHESRALTEDKQKTAVTLTIGNQEFKSSSKVTSHDMASEMIE